MLETPHVFIDTNQWYALGFNWNGARAQALAALVAQRLIEPLTTSITAREILSNLRERVVTFHAALRTIRRFRRDIEQFTPALWPALPDDTVTVDTLMVQATAHFETYMRGLGTTTIDCFAGASDVFDAYFEERAPFGVGGNGRSAQKKHEFPDAFVVDGLNRWADRHETRVYVVSSDQGVKDACAASTRLIAIDTLQAFLDLAYGGEALRPWLTSQLGFHQDEIVQRMTAAFSELPFEVSDGEGEIEQVAVDNVTWDDVQVLWRPDAETFVVDVEAEVAFTATGTGPDPDSCYRDDDTKELIYLGTRTATVDRVARVSFRLEVHGTPDEPDGPSTIEDLYAHDVHTVWVDLEDPPDDDRFPRELECVVDTFEERPRHPVPRRRRR